MASKIPYSKEQCENITKLILGTINSPRPNWIEGAELWECVRSRKFRKHWKPHLIALYEEVGIGSLHDAVLCRYATFQELFLMSQVIEASNTEQVRWIKEMAGFEALRQTMNLKSDD